MEYNTTRRPLLLKEYGRNVQKLADYISEMDSKEKRTEYAHTLVSLMKQLNNSVKEGENLQRIWDHLYVIANFDLDIDSPYPMPDVTILTQKPKKMLYKTSEVRFKHYGRHVEILVRWATKLPSEEREEMAFQIGKLMTSLYGSSQKESLEAAIVAGDLFTLSEGVLDFREKAARNTYLFSSPNKNTKNGGGSNPKPRNGKKGK